MSFLTPILARFNAEIEAAVELAKANILIEFEGLSAAATQRKPGAHAAARPRYVTSKPAKGQKRTPEELSKTVEAVFSAIKQHPGERIEQLSARIGLPTKEMNLPIKKLRADKRIVAAGQKRATTYRAK